MSGWERAVLALAAGLLLAAAAVLLGPAARAADPEGPFYLVLRFSHHVFWGDDTVGAHPDEPAYVDRLDALRVVPVASQAACKSGGLAVQARFQRPAFNAYVDFSCLPRRVPEPGLKRP